jgi:hypothetical protein
MSTYAPRRTLPAFALVRRTEIGWQLPEVQHGLRSQRSRREAKSAV